MTSTETPPRRMTVDEFLALPPDGMDRELIRGELRERPMATRHPLHSYAQVKLSYHLEDWLQRQTPPAGEIHAGDTALRLPPPFDSLVGIDVAWFGPEAVARYDRKNGAFLDLPTLAVEILSPNNTYGDIMDKIELYLEAGVPMVWLIETRQKTITAYRPGVDPEMFTSRGELTAEPHLPGFRVPVAKLFK